MNLTTLPTDILHNIVLGLPVEQQGLLCLNKGLRSNIYNNNGFWYRRYICEYGRDAIFDDCPELGWKQRYTTRRRMYRLHNSDIRARKVISDYDDMISINPDGTVDKYVCTIKMGNYDVEAVDIFAERYGRDLYIVKGDGTVLLRCWNKGYIRDDGWPKAKCFVHGLHYEVLLITEDDRLFIINPRTMDLSGDRPPYEGEYIDMDVKSISLSRFIGAYIDTDDSVWFSVEIDEKYSGYDIPNVTWRRFFDMKGKRVVCHDGVIMLIDMDDNVWKYSRYVTTPPTQIDNIKGSTVQMDGEITMIIDTQHNLWLSGMIETYIPEQTGWIDTPVKWKDYKALDVYISDFHRCIIGTEIHV